MEWIFLILLMELAAGFSPLHAQSLHWFGSAGNYRYSNLNGEEKKSGIFSSSLLFDFKSDSHFDPEAVFFWKAHGALVVANNPIPPLVCMDCQTNQDTRDSSPGVYLLPGEDSYISAAIPFDSSRKLELSVGRIQGLLDLPEDLSLPLQRPLTGAFFRVREKDRELRFVLAHLPSLAGGGVWHENTSINPLLLQREIDLAVHRSNRLHNNGSSAHALDYTELGTWIDFYFSYEIQNHKCSLPSWTAPSECIHRADYANAGLGYETPLPEASDSNDTASKTPGKKQDSRSVSEFYLKTFFSIERFSGYYRTEVRSLDYRGMELSGFALRWFLQIRYWDFQLRSGLFLPEPPGKKIGSLEQEEERSGYAGYGQAGSGTSYGGGVIRENLYPEISFRSMHPDPFISITSEGRNSSHIAHAFLDLTYYFQSYAINLQTHLFRPLANRNETSGNPFSRLKRDPEAFEHLEVVLGLKYGSPKNSIGFQYSSLYRRDPQTGKKPLSGETWFVYLITEVDL